MSEGQNAGTVYLEIRGNDAELAGDVKKSVAQIQRELDLQLDLKASQTSIKSLEGVYAQLKASTKLVGGQQLAGVEAELRKVVSELSQEVIKRDQLTAALKQETAATVQNTTAKKQNARVHVAQGLRSNLLNTARGALAGEDVGQLAAFGAKAGAIGFAITAGYQAVNRLQTSLKVTGEEAETATGRMRNFGASILSGDIVGGIQALANASDTLNRSELDVAETLPQVQQEMIALFGEAKVGTQVLADLGKQAETLGVQAGTLSKALQGVNPENLTAIQSRISALAPGFDTKSIAAAAQAQLRAQATQRDAARNTQFELLKARAGDDDKALAGVLNARKASLQRQIGQLEESGSSTVAAKQRLVTLYGQLESVDGDLTNLRKQQLAEQQRQAEEQHRIAQAQAQTAFTTIAIQAANATNRSQEITALEADAAAARGFAQDKHFTDQERLQYELQAATDDKQIRSIRAQIAAEAAANAAEAARLAEEERKREEEKLKRQREAAKQMRELRLTNAEAKAQLTKSTADDRAAIKASIAYWKQQVASLTGLQREQARAELIAARGRLKGLSQNNTSGGSADFFGQVLSDFRQFGSNFTGLNGGVLSPQGARGQFAAAVLSGASTKSIAQALQEDSNRTNKQQLAEARKQTALLSGISKSVGAGARIGVGKPTVAKVNPGVIEGAEFGAGVARGS